MNSELACCKNGSEYSALSLSVDILPSALPGAQLKSVVLVAVVVIDLDTV